MDHVPLDPLRPIRLSAVRDRWRVRLPRVRCIDVQLDFVPVRILQMQALRESTIRHIPA
jgi:hypothetical protein